MKKRLEGKSDERVEKKAGTATLLYWWSRQWSKTQANKNGVFSGIIATLIEVTGGFSLWNIPFKREKDWVTFCS